MIGGLLQSWHKDGPVRLVGHDGKTKEDFSEVTGLIIMQQRDVPTCVENARRRSALVKLHLADRREMNEPLSDLDPFLH
jgi:hypothetical protein